MDYTVKDMGSYNLHIIKTKKYKTITVRVIFRRKVVKEEITLRNILASLLVQSTKQYDSKRKMTIKSQDLYATTVSVENIRVGNYTNMIFKMNVLNDKFTEEGNFNKALEFLNEVIFNPDIEINHFKEKQLDIIKAKKKIELAGLKENLGTYSLVRAMESFDSDAQSSYRMMGYIEDLEKIDGKKAYDYYQDILNKDVVDVFVVGDIDEAKFVQDIKKYFKLRVLKKRNFDYYLEEKKSRVKRLLAKETINANQTMINIVCRTNKLSEYEKEYVMPVCNVIFGAGTDSKLFKIVREKNSLCYSIYSSYKKHDNILVIKTGINKENYKKTISLAEKLLKDMQRGKFEDEDIRVAKQFFETAFDEIDENPAGVIELYMSIAFLGSDDLETKRKMIEKVTKNEIIKVAKKIQIDTIFTLEGDEDEEARV